MCLFIGGVRKGLRRKVLYARNVEICPQMSKFHEPSERSEQNMLNDIADCRLRHVAFINEWWIPFLVGFYFRYLDQFAYVEPKKKRRTGC